MRKIGFLQLAFMAVAIFFALPTMAQEEKVVTLSGNAYITSGSNAAIDEMGLTRETIMKTDLRGVAIGGCCAGDIIVLYTKDKKLKYGKLADRAIEDLKK